MTTTSLVPTDIQLPARLRTPEAVAAIAAANAEAAGGLKGGRFPHISIKANKFHEVDGGTTVTYNLPAAAGQPALPMMCLETVIMAWNPTVSKAFYQGEYVEGQNSAPDCSSANGIVPDAHIAVKQNPVCATCPQNKWGSKISKLSGKEIKACDDYKQLVVLPGGDLNYKALGFAVPKGSLGNLGKYVQTLDSRGLPIDEVVTNITFDATRNGVLVFSFNRLLDDDQAARVKQRAQGDDAKLIVAARVSSAPQLPAPAATPALAAPAPVASPVPTVTTGFGAAHATLPPPPPPTDPFAGQPPHVRLAVDAAGGYDSAPGRATYAALVGAAPQTPVPTPQPEAPKRTRRTREQIAADKLAEQQATVAAQPAPPDLAYLPPAIRAAIEGVGVGTPAGQALLAQFPRPGAPATPPAAPPVTPVVPPAPAVAPSPPPTTTGFGAAPPVAPAAPTAQVTASAASLVDKLRAKLAENAAASAAGG